MTAKEALDKLDKTVTGDLEWKIALTEALEKQIAKKPKYDDGYYCPFCDYRVDDDGRGYKQPYCMECGQKLDWSVQE